jgi:hypothetical protein
MRSTSTQLTSWDYRWAAWWRSSSGALRAQSSLAIDLQQRERNAATQPLDDRLAIAAKDGIGALVEGTIERWFTPAFVARAPQEIAKVRAFIEQNPSSRLHGVRCGDPRHGANNHASQNQGADARNDGSARSRNHGRQCHRVASNDRRLNAHLIDDAAHLSISNSLPRSTACFAPSSTALKTP